MSHSDTSPEAAEILRERGMARLPAILADVRAALRANPDIDQHTLLMVNFNSFGASSLDFFIYCFTRTVVWAEYHAVKEQVLFQIADIIARHGGEIAFPTRTLHVPEELRLAAGGEEPRLVGAQTSERR